MNNLDFKSNNWISVKDQLPDFDTKVLVRVFPRHPVMEGQLTLIDRRIKVQTRKGTVGSYITSRLGSFDFTSGEVTHWMPLPEPPKPKTV